MSTGVVEPTDRELLVAAAEDLGLYTSLMYPAFDLGEHHAQIIDALECVANGEIDRLIINMPPRHGKSLLASEHFPAWYLGRNPDRFVISATYAQDLANDWGAKVRNQVKDPLYQAIFPGVTLAQDSASMKRFRTPQGGTYFAAGRGSPMTGRGAHLLLIDDPYKNMAEADSVAVRKQVQAFYTSTAYTRLMPGGAIVLIQTRWRADDLAGWLQTEHKHERWKVLELKAIDGKGRALWPSRYSVDALRRIQRTVTTREWDALYQQQPFAEEGAILKRHWWRPWTDPRPPRPDFVIVSVDSAYTAEESNDPTGITIWFVCQDASERSCALLVGAIREWLEFNELILAIEEAHSTFAIRGVPIRVLVETKATGLSVVQELRRKHRDWSIHAAKTGRDDKVARAHSVTSLLQHDPDNDIAGRVYALARLEAVAPDQPDVKEPRFRPWAQMVIDECAAFPLAAHDDLTDSVTHALRHMRDAGVEFFAEDEPPPPPMMKRRRY